MNKVVLIGNLAKDPELTTTNNGVSHLNVRYAIIVLCQLLNEFICRALRFFRML